MRVHDTSGNFDKNIEKSKNRKIGEKTPAKGVSREKVNESNFMEQLTDATEEHIKKSLDQLLEELSEQAQVLVKKRTFLELDKYKSLVKNFMKKTIEKMYSVTVSNSSKYMVKRKKVFVLVEKVDEELEKLAQQMLSEQTETLDLLGTIDRIRGLLVDMYS